MLEPVCLRAALRASASSWRSWNSCLSVSEVGSRGLTSTAFSVLGSLATKENSASMAGLLLAPCSTLAHVILACHSRVNGAWQTSLHVMQELLFVLLHSRTGNLSASSSGAFHDSGLVSQL